MQPAKLELLYKGVSVEVVDVVVDNLQYTLLLLEERLRLIKCHGVRFAYCYSVEVIVVIDDFCANLPDKAQYAALLAGIVYDECQRTDIVNLCRVASGTVMAGGAAALRCGSGAC